MSLEGISNKLDDLTEATQILIDGLKLQTASLGAISEMVGKVLYAVADRDEPASSPLADALAEIVGVLARHSRSLDRIESRLVQIERSQI